MSLASPHKLPTPWWQLHSCSSFSQPHTPLIWVATVSLAIASSCPGLPASVGHIFITTQYHA